MPKIIIKPLIAPPEDPDETELAVDEDDDDAFDDQVEDEPIMKRARGRPRGAGRARATAVSSLTPAVSIETKFKGYATR